MAPLFEAFRTKKSALFLEKGAHEGSAFIGEDARGCLGLGVEGRLASIEGMKSAFGIVGSPDDTAEAGPSYCARTHIAGFYGDIQRAFGKHASSEVFLSGRYGDHLGVGGYVGQALGLIVAATDDAVVAYHNCAYRHFVFLKSHFGLGECLTHPVFVSLRCHLLQFWHIPPPPSA